MSLKNDEKRLYNSILKNVEFRNKALVGIYKKAAEKVESRLAKYRMDIEAGKELPPNEPFRRRALLQQIEQEIEELHREVRSEIRSGFYRNYEDTYYSHAYYTEKAVNVEIPGVGGDYILNYPPLNTSAIESALEAEVAGHTFSERIGQDKVMMQFRVRTAVAQVIAEGQTTRELKKRLKLIDDAFASSEAKAMTTARTEMLRAYSLGQDRARVEAQNSGVLFAYEWSAALDGKTRPDHRAMDGKQAQVDDDGDPVFTLPDGSKTAGPRMAGLSADQSINCRCRRLDLPYGIRPTQRVARLPDGEWTRVDGTENAESWVNKNYGRNKVT